MARWRGGLHSVSIPFKREGSFRVVQKTLSGSHLSRFQFPSNGKARSELSDDSTQTKGDAVSFNSLQTGRLVQRQTATSYREQKMEVSIPFKREGSFRVLLCLRGGTGHSCFNSLQTGRLVQSVLVEQAIKTKLGFNSLQTGRLVQSVNKIRSAAPACRFNSLQTGRLVQSQLMYQMLDAMLGVSIPFKREGSFRETPICTQWGRGFVAPKPYTNAASLFWHLKFTLKTPRTLVNTEPYAIF